MIYGLLIFVLIALGALVYWQIVVAEGAYLGKRVVIWLYDQFAPRYERSKKFDADYDAMMLAAPILEFAQTLSAPCAVLDVATGTARLPRALLAQPSFGGAITAIDLSAKMLDEARVQLGVDATRVKLMQHDAEQLPFDAGSFDVVACLEALEFMREPHVAISEMLRVLKPNGLLMLSNRIGPDAWKLPKRALPTDQFTQRLQQLGARDIEVHRWLVDYDLVLAKK